MADPDFRLDALRKAEVNGEIIALTGPNSAATPGAARTPVLAPRAELHARITDVLKDQDYGHRRVQPCRSGMANAIVNEIWADFLELDLLRSKVATLVRDHADGHDEGPLYADLCQVVDRDPAIRAHLDRITPTTRGGGR